MNRRHGRRQNKVEIKIEKQRRRNEAMRCNQFEEDKYHWKNGNKRIAETASYTYTYREAHRTKQMQKEFSSFLFYSHYQSELESVR